MSLKTAPVVLLHRAATNQSLASLVAGCKCRVRPVPWSSFYVSDNIHLLSFTYSLVFSSFFFFCDQSIAPSILCIKSKQLTTAVFTVRAGRTSLSAEGTLMHTHVHGCIWSMLHLNMWLLRLQRAKEPTQGWASNCKW